MSIIVLVVVLAIVGLITWAAVTYIPMPATIKRVIVAVVVIALILWLLRVTGLLDAALAVRV